MLEFADGFLIGNAPLLLFRLKFKKMRGNVKSYSTSYGFSFANDWWTIHELPFMLPYGYNTNFT